MPPANDPRPRQMHALAAQFRGFATQTQWLAYRARMLEMAEELDAQAALIEQRSKRAAVS